MRKRYQLYTNKVHWQRCTFKKEKKKNNASIATDCVWPEEYVRNSAVSYTYHHKSCLWGCDIWCGITSSLVLNGGSCDLTWHRSVHLCSMGMYIHHKWVCPKQHITNFYFSPIQSWLSILYIRTVHKNTWRNKLQLTTKPYYVTMSGAYKLGNNANYTIASSDGWLICTPLYWDAYIVETVKNHSFKWLPLI